MALALDVGDADDIHPRNKFDVGERLARWALAHDRPVRFADLPGTNLLAEPESESESRRDRADPLAALAAAAGFDDPERWWEDAVELRHHGLDAFASSEALHDLSNARHESLVRLVKPMGSIVGSSTGEVKQ